MLEIKRNEDTLDVIGEVDISTAQIFKDGISELVEDGVKVIRLNMDNTEYIDSTGIGILMDIRRNYLDNNQSIILVNPKRSIFKLMQLTGVDRLFTIERNK